MKKIYLFMLMLFALHATHAQNTCATAVPITAIPFASGTLTTCGAGNDYAAGSLFNTSYGGGEDYVFSIDITNAPVTYSVALGGSATYKIASVHSACPPTNANSIGGVTTGSGTTGTAQVSFATNGTYYIIVDTWPDPTCGEFTLSLSIPPPPPANNEAAGAVALTVNADYACGATTNGTTVSSTQSAEGAPTCSATGINDDVWFTFVATSSTHRVSFSAVSTGTMVAALYSGSPGSLVFVTGACASTTLNATGLTAGTTYYVRAYTSVATVSTQANFTICVGTPLPAPANDVCSGAITLAVNATCINQTFTTAGATDNNETGDCTDGTEAAVWFKFTATQTNATITVDGAVGFDAVLGVLSGCGSTTAPTGGACVDNTGDGGIETRTLSGLTVGQTYYIQVYDYQGDVLSTSSFDICVVSLSCPAPTGLAVGSITSNSASVTWTGSGNFILEYGLTGFTPGTGATAGVGGTLISAATSPQALSGLTVSTGYSVYIRLDCTASGSGYSPNATVAFTTTPPPPPNDNICGAVSLTPSAGATCTTALIDQTTAGATQSSAGCAGTADDDVWYSFVATNTTHIITLSTSGTGSTDRVHQLYSSSDNTCTGTLTSLTCSDPETSTTGGLTVGNTYFVRVFSYSSGNVATFNICVTLPAPPPANDNICGAVSLTASAGAPCTTALVNQTTAGGTQSSAGCVGTADDDVWYSFVATNTTHIITLSNSGTGSTDRVHQLYSSSDNTCTGTLTSLTCSDPETSTTSGLTVGNTYFVRVFSYSSGNVATFNICVTSPAPPPVNDECIAATTIGSVTLNSATSGSTQSQAASLCSGGTSTSALDAWYKFTAVSNGDALVTISANSFDVVLQAFSGTCGNLVSLGCIDGFSSGGEVLSLTGLTAGQTYYVRVYGWNGTSGTFDISVTGAALPIAIEYFKGSKQNGGHLLDWKVSCYSSPSVNMQLERSADGRSFTSINSQTETATRCLQPFSFTDASPLAGINYYRLKSVDVDGKISYSKIVALLNKDKGFEIVSLVPNPVKEEATLSVTSATKSIIEIVVTDLSGKQLSKQRVSLIAGNNLLPLNVRNLPAGSYQVTGITADGVNRTLRFVKQ